MKVNELLEAKIDKPFGNANSKPIYHPETGHLRGSTRDWLTLGDATLADVQKAIPIIKQSDIFKQAENIGLKYEGKPTRERNGSLYFARQMPLKKLNISKDKDSIIKAALKALKAGDQSKARQIVDAARIDGLDFPEFKSIDKSLGDTPASNSYYIVYPNGQVRVSSDGAHYYALIKSPKPRMVVGDPVKSIVKTYAQAIERMIDVWKKSRERKEPYYMRGAPRP